MENGEYWQGVSSKSLFTSFFLYAMLPVGVINE